MAFMNEFCDTPFWDWNVTWYTENPDFTECFKGTALQWIPCLVLWTLLPLELYKFKTSQMRDIPYNKYNVIKLAAIICIIGTGLAELGDNIINDVKILANIYSPVIKVITHILFLLLTWTNIKMGIRSSGILLLFSFSSLTCGIPLARDFLRYGSSTENLYDESTQNKRYIFFVYYLSTIIVLIQNCFLDRKPRLLLCDINDKLCPSQNSSFLSNMYLCWFTKYLWKGYKKPFTDILWHVNHEDSAAGILPSFEKYWNKALRKQKTEKKYEINGDCISLSQKPYVYSKKPVCCSIVGPLLRLVWFKMLQAFFWRVLECIMNLSAPLIFTMLITSIKDKQPIWKTYACVLLFFVGPFFHVVILREYFEAVLKAQIRVRAAILSVVYKKALKISNDARKQYGGGDIVNLVSVDIARIWEFMRVAHHTWSAPAQILISLYFIWNYFGISTLSSIVVIAFILIANHYVVKYSKSLCIKEMLSKDIRCKFLQEILSGIKVLKMYAWESSFEKIALKMRHTEMRYLKKYACIQVILSLFFSSTPFLLPLVTFATYVLSDVNNVLDVKKAFICISFFNGFRTPMYQIPNLLSSVMQAYVTIKRINKFLNLEELDPDAVTHEDTEEALIIEKGRFSWENNESSATLQNINLKIKEGSLVAIVGPVGAGKSSLISAFLGEMYKLSGYVNVKGTTAYIPQQAWMLNASLKENITLGDVIDDTLYHAAIDACALKADLQTLSDGDLTEIGEKGVNLSGGQKQRISLARAVCSNKDIYFFDDPLSAVDVNVAEHIFQRVLGPEGILRTKTRVLVTHSTTFLHKVDLIIVLKKGSISESGTFNEIMRNDEEFADFLRSYCKDIDEKREFTVETDKNIPVIDDEISETETIDSVSTNTTEEVEKKEEKSQQIKFDDDYIPKKLINKERMESGNIKLKVYWYYVKSAGPLLVLSTIILYIVFQCFSVAANLWLAKWTENEKTVSKNDRRLYYLSIYIIFGLCQEICIVLANSAMFKYLLQASLVLYNRLLINILRWPMSQFDSTPVGRIINRFTVDMDTLDNNLGNKLVMLYLFVSKFLAVFFVIVSSIPFCVLFLIPTILLMYIVQKFYMALSHQLKRIDSVHRSPLYSHFVETTSGLESIRAYNIQEKFHQKILNRNDLCSATAYGIFASGRWLGMRLEILVGMIISLTSYFVISQRDIFNESALAFIISYTIQISKEVNMMILHLTEVENVIVSVERIKEFIDKPREPDQPVSSTLVSSNWPAKGQIIFQNYKLRYRDELDLVLKNVNFTIQSGEKVGIIGRTGAGKTSIISALFRIVEPADGKIFIDGVDISTISLHLLRLKLTVIPQDPVLFVGTLRFNLDPFDSYTDNILWDVLHKAHLKDFVRGLPNSLYYKIEEGGGNLSFGQKQLICLARALLRKTKILVLDEATASVDLETDELIQRTIRKEFSDCTVLTIAHRLNTVQDYDKILVMENGIVVEFDAPTNLLSNSHSIFYKLAMDSGLLLDEKEKDT